MKTDALPPINVPLLQVVNRSQTPIDEGVLRIIYKSDLANHHFAQHGNQKVQDHSGLDASWFGNYE
jgi:hypothetical protein